MNQASEHPATRFDRLSDYLLTDPENLQLLSDAADAALDEGRHAEAAALIDRHAAIAPIPKSLVNVLGLCALAEQRHSDAAGIFESLLSDAPDDLALRFNLAWARSQLGDHNEVLNLLGADATSPQAAALVVRSLHHLGELEAALKVGDAWETRDGDAQLWGALASVALDADDLDRTASWAARAEGTADGLAAIGMLAMADARPDEARRLFEGALKLRPDSARGLLGLGSVLLGEGRAPEAAEQFDRAAEVFGDHLGTWIAAGWAWLIAGDTAAARERFVRVLDLDASFSEAQGGLAVVNAMEGRLEEAKRGSELALRLDRQSLGGALARSLLLEHGGDATGAARIREAALTAPIGPGGRSVAQMLALAATRGP